MTQVILAGGSSHTPKIAQRFAALFSENTPIHAPATDSTALNPAELAARGAALQASLISELDIEDIQQASHPAVTVAPHLSKAVGVVVVGADGSEEFRALLPAQTALPARQTAEFSAPAGNVHIKFVEAITESRKHTPPKRERAPDDSEDEDSEEEEEVKTKHAKVETVLAEAILKGVKAGQKVEVAIQAALDLTLNVSARIVGTQTGLRGVVKAPAGSK